MRFISTYVAKTNVLLKNLANRCNELEFHKIFVYSCILLLAIVSFRFNKVGIFNLFDPFINDAQFYESIVRYFRTSQITEGFIAPFTYRPLSPLIASFLPFNPLTSLNVVNIIFLISSLYVLQLIIKHYNFNHAYLVLGNLLFICSFPVFYYSTIGMVEPGLIFSLMLSFYLLIKKQYLAYMLLFLPGILMKETFIIALPVFWAFMLCQSEKLSKAILLSLGIIGLVVLATIVARTWAPFNPQYVWDFKLNLFIDNLTRIKTWLSGLLSLGIPGTLSLMAIFLKGKKWVIHYLPFYVGFILSILTYFYAILTAHSDGRFIWLSYSYIIPLSLFVINAFEKTGNTNN